MHAQLVDKQAAAATFTVTVPASEVDAAFERVLSQLARQVRIPGFRPGRAPRGVLLQRVGADALAEEVRETLVDEHYPHAVRELELMPVHAHFHGEPPVAGQDFTFEVHADLYPEFELPDLDAITIDTPVPELAEEQVEETIARIREEHATLVPIDRGIEAGDVIFVETLGEGGGSTMPIDLTRTEPHLVEQLLGRRPGDEVTLDLGPDPVPAVAEGADADAQDAESADGATTADAEATEAADAASHRTLAVRIDDVKAKELPEPDDAFAQTLGFESWEGALEEIRTGLTRQLEREAESAQRDEFVEKLAAATDVTLPRYLVNRRKMGLLENLAEDLRERQRTSIEQYLAALDERGQRTEFEAELQAAAERAVKRDLVLEALLERQQSTLSDAEFEAAVRHMAMRERKDPRRFRDEMGEEWLRNYRFLLARDRAVREVVAAKTGRGAPTTDAEAAEAAAFAASDTTGDDYDDHDHDDHDHDHDHDHHDDHGDEHDHDREDPEHQPG
jgi:trigger factor